MQTSLKPVESALKITLPKAYITAHQRMLRKYSTWPEGYESFGDRLIIDSARLIDINRAIRANPKRFVRTPANLSREWPNELFVFAGSPGIGFWCFDIREKNPQLLWIVERRLDGGPFPAFKDLLQSIGDQHQAIHEATRKAEAAEKKREAARQKKEKKKRGSRPAADRRLLDAQDFLEEATQLARPALHLTPNRSRTRAAVWSADRDVDLEGLRPWLTIDLRCHPDESLRRNGVLDILVDDSELQGKAVFSTETLRRPRKDEVSLFGKQVQDLPCLDVLFRKGSRRFKRWLSELEENGWKNRDWPQDPDFPAAKARDRYHKHWASSHAISTGTVDVQLGGWPLTWPEESADEQLRRKLVLRTYRDSEPWVEVFQSGKGYKVLLRLT